MPFHVEIRHGMRRASAFNLDQERLRDTVLDPWRRGRPVELGDREWDPRDSSLRVLEGPRLETPELAYGQGWGTAERSARDVTQELLTAASEVVVAVIAATEAGGRAVAEALERLGVRTIEWASLRARIMAASAVPAGRPAVGVETLVAVLVVEGPEPGAAWLFDAGLALGALGGAAIMVQFGDEPAPAALRDIGVVRLDLSEPATLHALAERLRQAGSHP